jgi:hypothetical protein
MMFGLKLVEVALILAVAIFGIAFLEETLISGPRRKALERKRREKLAGKQTAE